MALYWVSVDAVALVASTAKSIFEIGTSASTRAKIVEWWVEFDGVSSSAVPVKIEVGRFSAAVTTATTITPFKYDPADGAAGSTTKHSTATEGAGTASDVEIHRVSPTTGILVQYPLGREITLAVSTFARIRCTAAANVNATFGVIWEE